MSRIDNDQYSHVNNSVYYHLFDSVVNTFLIQRCGLTSDSAQIGLVVLSHCQVSTSAKRLYALIRCSQFQQ